MILTADQKTVAVFNQIKAISDASFADSNENPPFGVLNNRFERDDIFIHPDWSRQISVGVYEVAAFAIVTERGGPYIWSIATRPELQRRGFGKALLEEIAKHYRQAGRQSIGLTCKTTNPAQKLYFDCGYRAEKVAQGYYGPEGDGLVMRRVL